MPRDERADPIKQRCEGKRCQVTFVRARWRRRRNANTGRIEPIEPSVGNVQVAVIRPSGALIGMGARMTAVELIQSALRSEDKVIAGKCEGDCSCEAETPDDEEFEYKSWTITVEFHEGGRDPHDPSDRVDFKASFKAKRAEVTVDGECKIQFA